MNIKEIEAILDKFLYDSAHKHVSDKDSNLFSFKEGYKALDVAYALLEFEAIYACNLHIAIAHISSFTLSNIAEALLLSGSCQIK